MANPSTVQRVSVGALKFYPQMPPADPQIQKQILALWYANNSFIILSGPPGVGKTRAAEDFVIVMLRSTNAPHSVDACRVSNLFPNLRTTVISNQDLETTLRVQNIQFVWDIAVLHPQYTYEDLVRGYRMSSTSTDIPKLEVREGLLGFLARVSSTLDRILPTSNLPRSTLILDEINRAPIGQLFGESLYALDRRGIAVSTPYELSGIGSDLVIPRSLLLLGTMNSVDRAVAGFDFALRRRFAIVNLVSHLDAIRERYKTLADAAKVAVGLYENTQAAIVNAKQTGIVPLAELMLGHAYFMAPNSIQSDSEAIEWLARAYQFKIIPTLLDYQEQGLLEFQEEQLKALVGGDVLRNKQSIGEFQNSDVVSQLNALKGATP